MSDDLISRQAAIDSLLEALYDLDEYDFVDKVFIEEELKRVPSVQTVQKTGRWIDDNCSECGQYVYHGDANNYCPNCGAKMESEEIT